MTRGQWAGRRPDPAFKFENLAAQLARGIEALAGVACLCDVRDRIGQSPRPRGLSDEPGPQKTGRYGPDTQGYD